jgi:uncharacterized protein
LCEPPRAVDKLKDASKQALMEQRRLEGEVKSKQQEIEKTNAALNTCKSNDEYKVLLKAIDARKAEVGDLETKVLEVFEANDKRATDEKAAAAKLKTLEAELADAKKRVDAELGKIDAELKGLEADRRTAAAVLSPEHHGVYARVLEKQRGDPPIAAVVNEMCQGCSLKIRPEQISQLRARTHVLTCFECERILYLP